MTTTRAHILLTLRALLLAMLLAACGEGVVFISVNFGTVIGAPTCRNGSGQFDLRDQEGLVLLVLIDSDTRIIAANGGTAGCTDIAAESQVQVRGPRDGTTLTAQSVQLQ